MSDKVCGNTPSLNDAEKPDVFSRTEKAIDAVKCLGADAFGNPVKPKLPCDDMSKFRIEDCWACAEREVCGG